jgi:trehalose utilization protein
MRIILILYLGFSPTLFFLAGYLIRSFIQYHQADKGLLYCRFGKEYIWIYHDEYIRLFLEDHGE